MSASRLLIVVTGLLALLSGMALAAPTMALFENFTNTGCGYCAAAAPSIDTFLATNAENVVGIKWHTSGPSS